MRAITAVLVLAVVSTAQADLTIQKQAEAFVIQRDGKAILTQVAKAGHRPYLHPIIAPDGKGELTEYSPGHHKHQTGLYWGFTKVMVNGKRRDHFHHPAENYFKRKSARTITDKGKTVSWEVVYDLLGPKGNPVMTETKQWTLRDGGDHYVLDLVWSGQGRIDLTIGKYNYGGLFLRMPWKRGMKGAATNSNGEVNGKAEGKRADWVDIGMQVKGRDDLAHIVIMDHPENPGYPTPWRVDGQLGVGPCYARLGDWKIPKGKTATFKHRMLIYTGANDKARVDKSWAEYTKGAKKPTKKADAEPSPNPNDPNALILQIVATSKDPATQVAMLNGMLEGLKGQRKVRPPAGWTTIYPKLAQSPSAKVRGAALKLAQVFGDSGANRQLLDTVQNPKAEVSARREALHLLLRSNPSDLKPVLPKLLDDPALRNDAIRAYATVEDASAPKQLLERYGKLKTGDRRAVIETLAARGTYMDALFGALKSGKIPKRDVPAYTARSLQRARGKQFTEVWGEVKAVSADKAKQMARYKKLLTKNFLAKGDAANGRAIFARTCAACHTLYDTGGKVGPDITGANRGDLNYILYQIVDPNDDVPEAYRMVIVTTKDGQVVAGRVTEEDPQRLVLQTPADQKTILKNDIKNRMVSPVSMMPEGLLAILKDNEVRDLILYLRSNKQVPLPKRDEA
jgi:putative heme-binding domain-containing protein